MDLVSRFYREQEPLRRLIRELAAEPRAVALDVGCKEGDVSAALAPRVGWLVALDPVWSPAWPLRGTGPLQFVGGDVQRLPFRDASFDVVVAAECLQHVREPGAALDELARVLKVGGSAVLSFPEGGRLATLLDPYNLSRRVRRAFDPAAPRRPLVHHLRARRLFAEGGAHWRRRDFLRRGTLVFIYAAWAIDMLQSLRVALGPGQSRSTRCARRGLGAAIGLLFRVMQLDFSLSLGPLSYNNIIRLEKREGG